MVFKWQNKRILWCHESTISDGVDDIFEEDVSAHCLAVGDDGLLVFTLSVPTVQLHTAAAGQQDLSVHLDTGFPPELSAAEICVVRGVDVVVGQGLIHILVDVQPANLKAKRWQMNFFSYLSRKTGEFSSDIRYLVKASLPMAFLFMSSGSVSYLVTISNTRASL